MNENITKPIPTIISTTGFITSVPFFFIIFSITKKTLKNKER